MSFMGTNQFGGIIPKQDAGELPAQAAQQATDVDLSGGNLKKISQTAPFYDWHNGSVRDDEISAANVFPVGGTSSIPTPATPSVSSRKMLRNLGLDIKAYVWVSYIDPATGAWVSAHTGVLTCTLHDVEYTEYGMRIEVNIPPTSFTQNAGIRYEVVGPLFQFHFSANIDGPDSTINFPAEANLTPQNAKFPQCMMPYSDANGVVFGQFQVIRCDHMSAPEVFYDTEHDGMTRYVPLNNTASRATFYVDMNYVVNTRRYFYYCQTFFDADGNEGVPSEISDVCVVRPGEYAQVTVDFSSLMERLYRSVDGGSGFASILGGADLDHSPYVDTFLDALGQKMPWYGNPPSAGFDAGNKLHPSNFGIAFKDATLYFSDIYRLNAWPEEWTLTFPETIMAIETIGSSVVVFTTSADVDDGKIYMLTGNSPNNMGKYVLIASRPCINKLSICKIGTAVFYVSRDGLMRVTGSGAENVTREFYTRRQWNDLTPVNYTASVAENTVFLTHTAAGTNLRVDLDEGIARISEWTVITGGSIGMWRSRMYSFPRPVRFTTARLVANDYDTGIGLEIKNEDTNVSYTYNITDSNSLRLDRMAKARNWNFKVSIPDNDTIIVEHVAVASSTAELEAVNE